MTGTVISAEGAGNVSLIYSAMILGMLDLIENDKISHTDAQMDLFLPLLVREELLNENMRRAIGLAMELEAVCEYIPDRYCEALSEIRQICLKESENYTRNGNIRYTVS